MCVSWGRYLGSNCGMESYEVPVRGRSWDTNLHGLALIPIEIDLSKTERMRK